MVVKPVHPLNRLSMSVTLAVFHGVRSRIVRLEQLLNIDSMSVTLAVLKLVRPSSVKLMQPSNMLCMLVTHSVLKLLTSIFVRLEQSANNESMLVTLAVFQVERSSEVRLWHDWNMPFTFVIPLVLTLFRSIVRHWLKPLNISEQSPVKFIWLVTAVTLVTSCATTSSPHLSSLLNSPQINSNAPVVLSKVYRGGRSPVR